MDKINTFQKLKRIFQQSLQLPNEVELQLEFLGGMTNKNYLVNWNEEKYILRIPGAKTENLINRQYEANNSIQAANAGFNVETLFFDKESGVKITKYLDNSQTFNHQTIKNADHLIKIK